MYSMTNKVNNLNVYSVKTKQNLPTGGPKASSASQVSTRTENDKLWAGGDPQQHRTSSATKKNEAPSGNRHNKSTVLIVQDQARLSLSSQHPPPNMRKEGGR